MGWMRTLMLGDIGNRLDIGDCESSIDSVSRRLQENERMNLSQEARVRKIEAENDEAKLWLATIVRVLIAKNVITKDELMRLADAIDREDGSADGRREGPLV
jgi:hypothetical protein